MASAAKRSIRRIPDPGYGVPKLAYFAHRNSRRFEGLSPIGRKIESAAGVYVLRAMNGAKPIWFVWTANDEPRTVELELGASASGATAIDLVPRQAAGKDVDDYATAFDSRTVRAVAGSNGRVAVELGDRPVAVRVP